MTPPLVADGNPRADYAPWKMQVGRITPGWYLVAVTSERLKKDRTYVTALAYVPCPLFTWAVERPLQAREAVIEVDGKEVEPEEIWEWWTRLAHYPISREEFLQRRGLYHA